MGEPLTQMHPPSGIRIAPSLLSADFARLAEEVCDVQAGGADLLHLDLMDGHFVPNITFGPMVVEALQPHCAIGLDAHLMVTDPDPLIAPMAAAGTRRLSVHVEAVRHLNRTLEAISSAGMEPGVALNPATSLSSIEEVLGWVRFVLVMSVNPGFGGQSFIPASLDKIGRLSQMIAERRRRHPGLPEIDISVDGGVGIANAGALVAAGARTLVAGSSVFGEPDRTAAITRLRQAAAGGPDGRA